MARALLFGMLILFVILIGFVSAQYSTTYVAQVVNSYVSGATFPNSCLLNYTSVGGNPVSFLDLKYPGCVDSDGGINPLVSGVVTGTFLNVNFPNFNGFICGDFADYCDPSNNTILWELACGSSYGSQYSQFAGAVRVDCSQVATPGMLGICQMSGNVGKCI